jgi:acetoin utilization deacetylase AcuC-like enzyme
VLEGGYDLRGLAGSVAAHVSTLMGAAPSDAARQAEPPFRTS